MDQDCTSSHKKLLDNAAGERNRNVLVTKVHRAQPISKQKPPPFVDYSGVQSVRQQKGHNKTKTIDRDIPPDERKSEIHKM